MKKNSLINLINFEILGDDRGSLIALESNKTIPFKVKRIYYIFGTKIGVSRGFHAHRDLLQIAICVHGKCRILLDDGGHREQVWLDTPTKGLLIGNMIWREMHDFSSDCVLMVLASGYYNPNDYIRDYEKFQTMLTN